MASSNAKTLAPRGLPIRRILAAVDFSDPSRAALEYALALAERLGASVDVIHAWTSPAYVSPSLAVQLSTRGPSRTLREAMLEEAERQMASFLATVHPRSGVELRTRLEFGREADVILAASAEYDLLVMGTHGRGALTRAVLGSVAARVIRGAPCPVITLGARAALE